jgi:16S rRNA (guanine966-N2)-methyltransferase
MRIISGSHKGRKINAPKNLPVRPTTDRAKEALFNILSNKYDLGSQDVLDLFSGTGNISFEFASRNTQNIIAVDKNNKCVNFIKETSKNLNLNINKTERKFDIIFADPPYNCLFHNELKDLIIDRKLINEGGCLIIEHDKSTLFNDQNINTRKYGNVNFSILEI